MNKELTTQVEETEEQFKKRLNLAKEIVNRKFGVITHDEIRERLRELGTFANWYVRPYNKMHNKELWDYYLQVKKEICNKTIKPNFWEY